MKASRWEILGAWLRIWTPPKDVAIPPVPRRAAAVLGALVVVAIVLAATVLAPAIDRAKHTAAGTVLLVYMANVVDIETNGSSALEQAAADALLTSSVGPGTPVLLGGGIAIAAGALVLRG